MRVRENYMTENKISIWHNELERFIKHRELKPEDLHSSALLVIDMQNFFIEESSHAFIPSAGSIVPNINKLTGLYAELGLPVIFTRYAVAEADDVRTMERWWDDILMDGDPLSDLHSSISVPEQSRTVRKSTYDAFHGTGVKSFLEKRGVGTVVVTGVMTNLCCETSARSAFVNNFNVYFVIDANATMNEALHLSALKSIAHGFGVLTGTEELIEALKESKQDGECDSGA